MLYDRNTCPAGIGGAPTGASVGSERALWEGCTGRVKQGKILPAFTALQSVWENHTASYVAKPPATQVRERCYHSAVRVNELQATGLVVSTGDKSRLDLCFFNTAARASRVLQPLCASLCDAVLFLLLCANDHSLKRPAISRKTVEKYKSSLI